MILSSPVEVVEDFRRHQTLGIKTFNNLSEEKVLQVQKIASYDLWFVEERLKRKNLIPDFLIAEAVYEFRRYMALISLGFTGIAPRSSIVDEVWHTFILFTLEYKEFCENIFGRFVHHRPSTSQSPLSEDSKIKFRLAYSKVFGEITSPVYPFPEASCEDSGGQCCDCGEEGGDD